MITKIIYNSKRDWKPCSLIPLLHEQDSKLISDDLILFFDDGFISRGCYIMDEGWYGYDNNMKLEHYISDPKYYLTI